MQASTAKDKAELKAKGAEVLRIEADALLKTADHMPEEFGDAIEAIANCKCNIVVCGVGKSSHIGHKIASTLASTGTRSIFVHPSEASHGDLGMVRQGDIFLILSNSGESVELTDVITYAKRFSIPIIAISSNRESPLMRAASYRLLIQKLEEACPYGLAPTTSTTMMLALGDAIAVSLIHVRGFRAADFRNFHPGGKLGAQLKMVEDIMHPADALPLVSAATPMTDTLILMSERNFGVALLVDENRKLQGIITDGDLRRHANTLFEKTSGAIASQNPKTVSPDMFAATALAEMNAHSISSLPVVDENGVLVGLIHIHDLLREGVQ